MAQSVARPATSRNMLSQTGAVAQSAFINSPEHATHQAYGTLSISLHSFGMGAVHHCKNKRLTPSYIRENMGLVHQLN